MKNKANPHYARYWELYSKTKTWIAKCYYSLGEKITKVFNFHICAFLYQTRLLVMFVLHKNKPAKCVLIIAYSDL